MRRGLAAAALATAAMTDMEMNHRLLSDHLRMLLGLMQSNSDLAVQAEHARKATHAGHGPSSGTPTQQV